MNLSVNLLKQARAAFDRNDQDEALSILDNPDLGNNGEALFLKGEIFYKLQRWGDALNSFNIFLELHPSDMKAQSYCSMIHNILGFYHKDLYNP